MAVADIIAAIESETQNQLMIMRKQHQQRLLELKRDLEERLDAFQKNIRIEKDSKISQLHGKARTFAEQHRKRTVMQKRQEVIDTIIGEFIRSLTTLPSKQVETLLSEALKRLPKRPGTVFPAANHRLVVETLIKHHPHLTLGTSIDAIGGFRFVSDSVDADMTFETLVENTLKPRVELKLSQTLFG